MPTVPVTADAIRRQHARNATNLERDLERALATGKKVRGYCAEQLAYYVAELRHLSTADDAELAARRRLGLLEPGEKAAFLSGATFRQLLTWRIS
jgi:hypothetical protein